MRIVCIKDPTAADPDFRIRRYAWLGNAGTGNIDDFGGVRDEAIRYRSTVSLLKIVIKYRLHIIE